MTCMSDEQQDAEYVQVYVAAYPDAAEEIHTIRDTLRYELALDNYAPSNAHITVFPLVRVKRSDIPVIEATVRMLGLVGRPITIQGAGIWPNLKNPRVLLLDCDINLQSERQQLKSLFECLDVDTPRSPTPPHITLLKTESARSMDSTTKENLVQRIGEHRNTWKTTIKYVDIVVKDDA